MTVTLTPREREVLTHIARTLGRGATGDDVIVSNALLHFLDADFRFRNAETSASPPRVPGASAQCTRAGVESGPGQPMTHLLKQAAAVASNMHEYADQSIAGTTPEIDHSAAAMLIDKMAAEIRRLRDQVAAYRTGGGVIGDIRATNAYHAGIEAAARIEDDSARGWEAQADQNEDAGVTYGNLAAVAREKARRIRALADAPKSDPLPANEWPTHVEMERE